MRPVDLPAVRDAFLRHLNDPAVDRVDGISGDHPVGAADIARVLRAARLYWVTQPMAELTREVAEHEIAEVRWAEEDRPASSGFMIVEGGFGPVPAWRSGETATARALLWGPHPHAEKLVLVFLIARAEAEEIILRWQQVAAVRMRGPALTVCAGDVYPVESSYRSLADSHRLPAMRALLAWVQAAWLLMDMPGVADQDQAVPAPRRSCQVTTRASESDTGVTLIRIRRQQPDPRQRHGSGQSRYHHRWWVRPHKRWQACGPQRSQHRRILVGPYIKGPRGAPLLMKERVTVWER